MELTYILVDFENVQPQDLNLLEDQQFRVKVFHGSHQNKLDMTIVKALQPLGCHVEYVQGETPGKNALDFHVAFCMGRLLEAHQSNGMPARFGVISRDGGFEPLLRHVRSLGYAAKQAGSIREVLDFDGNQSTLSTPIASGSTLSARVAPAAPAVIATASDVFDGSTLIATVVQPQAAAKAVPAPLAAAITRKVPTANKTTAQPKATSTATKGPTDDVDKVIEHLRKHTKNRPTKRIALERYIPSLLGAQRSPRIVQALVVELEKRGIVEFGDNLIKYRIPAARK